MVSSLLHPRCLWSKHWDYVGHRVGDTPWWPTSNFPGGQRGCSMWGKTGLPQDMPQKCEGAHHSRSPPNLPPLGLRIIATRNTVFTPWVEGLCFGLWDELAFAPILDIRWNPQQLHHENFIAFRKDCALRIFKSPKYIIYIYVCEHTIIQ